jgi:DHA3 family macrolide efflux protein-like MFS transporter
VTEADNWKPRFFSIWVGQAFSLLGSALTQFVLLWWITDTTGSASALAIAGIAALLPMALLGPLGGTIADRWSRRGLMIAADAITAACILALVLLFAAGWVQMWHVYGLMLIRSSMQAFQQPAAAASTAMLVPGSWLQRVAGLNQTLFGLMTIAGAPLGALALSYLPFQGALMIDVVTALLGVAPLLFFRVPQIRTPPAEAKGVWAELKDGVDYVLGNRGLSILYGAFAVVAVSVMPTFTLTPLFVKEWFRGGVNQVAIMEALSGIGIILGGVAIGVWAGFRRRIVTVMVFFGVSLACVALAALTPPGLFWLGAFWWFVSGVTFSMGNAPLLAILQTIIPNQIQGRVLALMNTVFGLAGPVGLAIAGPLGEVIGTRGLFLAGGTVAGAVCLLALLSPALLRLEEQPAT